MAGWRETTRGVAFPWVCDQFGHMNVRWYAHAFDDAAFHLWTVYGIGQKWMLERDIHTVTARTTTDFRLEVPSGTLYVVESGFTRAGGKSVAFKQRMIGADTGDLHATQEIVEVFFDPATRTSAPIPDEVRAVVEANLLDEEE
jgi:acyl-CoA thioester hydrolase